MEERNINRYDFDSDYAKGQLTLNQYVARTYGWMFLGLMITFVLAAALALALLRLEGCGQDALLILLLPIGAAMLFRALSLDYAGTDYKNFLTHWYAYFQEHGGFSAVAHAVGDYNVPYLYFMAFISYLSAPDLYLIKLFSLLFDVILAWGCYRLVRSLTRERQGSIAPLIAFAAALLLPTVVLNGALWGQCDGIYGALCVHAAACVLDGCSTGPTGASAAPFTARCASTPPRRP